jgi:CheY-like chemotaxis protein
VHEDDARVNLKFTVHDTGAGATRDQLVRLFQNPPRPDGPAGQGMGGAGLGLEISRRLVGLMGGEVGAESNDGGSTYWFRVTLEKQTAPTQSSPRPNVQLRGMRVLVVDPARTMRQSVTEMLTAWGCSTDDAETGEEALQKLRAAAALGAPYRVALIDMNTPDMDGERLGGAIRDEETLNGTLTVLMTSIGRKGDAQRAQTMGFSAYLLKPIEWPELYDALIEVVHVRETGTAGSPQPLVTRHSLAEARRGRMRILLVEDNAVNQLVANWALQRLGYSIEVANTASEALQKVEAQRYDLILMDIQMPDMDGYKATSAIRARERGGMRTPVMAMAGNTDAAELERCRAAGMDDCIAKPIDIGQLCNLVERWTKRDPNAASDERATRGKEDHITLKAPELERKLEEMARGGGAAKGAKAATPGPAARPRDARPASSPAEPEDASVPIDNVRLEESSMGIVALRDTLLTTYLAEVPPRLERLAEAIQAKDARRVEFEAHGLKAMCATVGAVACGSVFAEMERLASEERLADLAGLLPRARAEVERTEGYIARLERILNRAA